MKGNGTDVYSFKGYLLGVCLRVNMANYKGGGMMAIEALKAEADPTFEQIEEYCRKRCLVVVDGALFNEMKSRWGAEPIKHGRWSKDVYGYALCSVCGGMARTDGQKLHYCPWCGAKMDEV